MIGANCYMKMMDLFFQKKKDHEWNWRILKGITKKLKFQIIMRDTECRIQNVVYKNNINIPITDCEGKPSS